LLRENEIEKRKRLVMPVSVMSALEVVEQRKSDMERDDVVLWWV
jgi:hypothetical protein